MKHLLLILVFAFTFSVSFAENNNQKTANDSKTEKVITEKSKNPTSVKEGDGCVMYFELSCGISGWIGADDCDEMWDLYCAAEKLHCGYVYQQDL